MSLKNTNVQGGMSTQNPDPMRSELDGKINWFDQELDFYYDVIESLEVLLTKLMGNSENKECSTSPMKNPDSQMEALGAQLSRLSRLNGHLNDIKNRFAQII